MACKVDRLVAWFQDHGLVVEIHEAQPLWPFVLRLHLVHGPKRTRYDTLHGFGRTLNDALLDLRNNTSSELRIREASDREGYRMDAEQERKAAIADRQYDEWKDRQAEGEG